MISSSLSQWLRCCICVCVLVLSNFAISTDSAFLSSSATNKQRNNQFSSLKQRRSNGILLPISQQKHFQKVQSFPRRRRSCLSGGFKSNSFKSGEDDNDHDGWNVGNVYEDIYNLEQAIIVENADFNLIHQQNVNIMNYMATKNRRPLLPDIIKYMVRPLLGALLIRILSSPTSSRKSSRTIIRIFPKSFTKCMDIQFWTMVVASPIVLLCMKRIWMTLYGPPPPQISEELIELYKDNTGSDTTNPDNIYDYFDSLKLTLPYTNSLENPKASCKDNVLVLLEYWASAVIGMAISGTVCRLLLKGGRRQSPAMNIWFAICQLTTRIGAVAALYQYPKRMYEMSLSESQQPLTFFETMLYSCIKAMLVILPVGLTSDISKLICLMGIDSVISLYSGIAAFMISIWIRMQSTLLETAEDPNDDSNSKTQTATKFGMLRSPSSIRCFRDSIALLLFWRKPLRNLYATKLFKYLSATMTLQQRGPKKPTSAFLVSCLGFLLSSCLLLPPMVIPICHMIAVSRIFRIVHTHDLSLALKTKQFKSSINNDELMSQRMKWRYRLEWRDDQRIGQVICEFQNRFWYWLFIEGRVREQLELEKQQGTVDEAMAGKAILERKEKELLSMPPDTPRPKRNLWKKDAMKYLAERHQSDYDNKTPSDPLGIAVQQTLGIGLGYNFDHMTPVANGEVLTTRRLQTRAAKSAIKRCQELLDLQKLNDSVASIDDPKERKAKKKELREATKTEMQYMAKKLTELVPIAHSTELLFDAEKTMQYNQVFKKVGSHEYRAVSNTKVGWKELMAAAKQSATGGGPTTITTKSTAGNNTAMKIEVSPSVEVIVDEDDSDNGFDAESYYDDALEWARNSNVTSTTNATSSIDEDDVGNDVDDEFVKAYLKSKKGRPGDEDNEDDDDTINMKLA